MIRVWPCGYETIQRESCNQDDLHCYRFSNQYGGKVGRLRKGGEILSDDETNRVIENLRLTRKVGEVVLKGMGKPVLVYGLLGRIRAMDTKKV